jgi:transcription initiation factor TFIID subunit 5
VQELPSSRFLLKTLRSKQTPMYRVHFTPRNLLLAGGIFQPKLET